MRPGADRLDDGRRLLPSELGAELEGGGPRLLARGRVGAGTGPLDAVELADELQDLRAGRRVVRLRLDELASHMRPAVGQREARTCTSERLVGAVPIGQDDAVVAVEHPAGRPPRAAPGGRVRAAGPRGGPPGPPA